jgi:altronate dehydratase small subunit
MIWKRRNDMSKAIVLRAEDNVATALGKLKKGESVTIKNGEGRTISPNQDIPYGHKIAIRDIKKGEHIMKYGEVIGGATSDISEGDHVHVHNIESLRARGDLAAGGE